LANSLANARLLEAQPMFRIYAGQWVDDAGASREVKFFVSRNIQSNWTISF